MSICATSLPPERIASSTALTTEVWYAVNDTWMMFTELLKNPIPETEVPAVLAIIRQQSALVRGALHGTMLRNDIYDFCSLGISIERMDSTARIIDVKYYSLLPAPVSYTHLTLPTSDLV